MRTCVLVRSIPISGQIGGSERQGFELAKNLAKHHDISIFLRKWNGEIDEFYKDEKLKIQSIPFINYPILRYFSFIAKGTCKLKKGKEVCDLIICLGLGPECVIAFLAHKFFRIPYIISIRSEGFSTSLTFIRKVLLVSLIRNAAGVTLQTRKLEQLFQKYFPRTKTLVIPNGIRLNMETAWGQRIIYAGRLINDGTQDKGIRYLIEALRGLPYEGLIIGTGPEENELRRLAKGLKIEFTGEIPPDKMLEHMKSGKILVLPSLTEGFPNVILEAMSIGMPVIATKVGGIPDIIEHGKTGFLVDSRNAAQISKYIELLMKDEKLYANMSRNCRKEVEKYSWENVIKQLELAIQDLCFPNRPGNNGKE
jgi:glycosyltransferase involved in cell wall biosynthesis